MIGTSPGINTLFLKIVKIKKGTIPILRNRNDKREMKNKNRNDKN